MIRKFEKADREQVMQIWLKGNMEAHPFVPGKYWESNYSMVQEQLLEAEVFVYEEKDEIQGFIGLADSYIAGIFVDRRYRSLGVGKMLLDHAKKMHSSLALSVYRQNQRAVSFYLREGFEIKEEGVDEETGKEEYMMLWQGGNT